MPRGYRGHMETIKPAAVARVLVDAGYRPTRPAEGALGGFQVSPGYRGGVAVYYVPARPERPTAASDNSMAIVAYARTLKAAGYRVEAVPIPAAQYTVHYLHVSPETRETQRG